jgi:hypothetical protein
MDILPTFRYEHRHPNKNSENELHGSDPAYNCPPARNVTNDFNGQQYWTLMSHYTSQAHMLAEHINSHTHKHSHVSNYRVNV